MSTNHTEPDGDCHNCGATLRGSYCSDCGQHVVDLDVPFKTFLKEFVGETLSLDSSLFRTLKPFLFKPGFLTQEYLAGRRARYLPPIRLYLVISFVTFFVMAQSPNVVQVNEGSANLPDSTVAAELEEDGPAGELLGRGLQKVLADPDAFTASFSRRMAQVAFVLLPIFALFLKVLFSGRSYVLHLVFSIYFHSFAFSMFLMNILCEMAGLSALGGLFVLAIPVYLLLGMRRSYQEGWGKTTAKWFAIGAAHTMTTLVGVAVAAIIAVVL